MEFYDYRIPFKARTFGILKTFQFRPHFLLIPSQEYSADTLKLFKRVVEGKLMKISESNIERSD